MTKDILIHQVSYVVNSATDSVILSIMSTLNNVTIYNAYHTIITFPVKVINKLVDNMRATIGKKLVSDLEGTYKVFNEALSLCFFLTAVMSALFILLANDFIILWIGKEFTLDTFCVVAFSLLLVQRTIMPLIYVARDGKGLYKESKNYTLAQTIANIIISLILVKKLGIQGLLIGTIASTYLISIPLNYNLVYKKVFLKKNDLIFKFFFNIIYALVLTSIIFKFNILINLTGNETWFKFILKGMVDGLIIASVTFILHYSINSSFRAVLKRFFSLRRSK